MTDTIARAIGWRAVIHFSPQVISNERIAAGVVVRLENGECAMRVAVPKEEAEHAFGEAGNELYYAAFHLCQALYEHVQAGHAFETWIAPFAGVTIGKLGRVEARDIGSLLEMGLRQNSVLFTMLSNYEMPMPQIGDSVVTRVRRAISKRKETAHLVKRFHCAVPVRADAMPLKVEFLGANYVCYFLQISKTARGLENSTGRAHGKLFELQSLERHFKADLDIVGIAGERPEQFELLVVGDKTDPIQKGAWFQIESLADSNKLRARIMPDASAAANEVARLEHKSFA